MLFKSKKTKDELDAVVKPSTLSVQQVEMLKRKAVIDIARRKDRTGVSLQIKKARMGRVHIFIKKPIQEKVKTFKTMKEAHAWIASI